VLSPFTKLERVRISKQVGAGLEKFHQQGRIVGRPTLDETKIKKIQKLKSSGMSIVGILKGIEY